MEQGGPSIRKEQKTPFRSQRLKEKGKPGKSEKTDPEHGVGGEEGVEARNCNSLGNVNGTPMRKVKVKKKARQSLKGEKAVSTSSNQPCPSIAGVKKKNCERYHRGGQTEATEREKKEPCQKSLQTKRKGFRELGRSRHRLAPLSKFSQEVVMRAGRKGEKRQRTEKKKRRKKFGKKKNRLIDFWRKRRRIQEQAGGRCW